MTEWSEIKTIYEPEKTKDDWASIKAKFEPEAKKTDWESIKAIYEPETVTPQPTTQPTTQPVTPSLGMVDLGLPAGPMSTPKMKPAPVVNAPYINTTQPITTPTVENIQPKNIDELIATTKAAHTNELDMGKIIADSAKFSLAYTYSRIPERLVYGTVNTFARLYAYGFKKVGLSGIAKDFESVANTFSKPPVTGKVDQKIAEMDAFYNKQSKLQQGAFKMTMAALEAVSFIERVGLVTSATGLAPKATEAPGVAKGILGKIFTGRGTAAEMAKRALTIGTMAAVETPGDYKTKFGASIYGIANYMTAFIANATGAVGWTAMATDTMLNAALDMPSFIKELKSAKNPGEFFVQAMPMMASWIIFALDTRGTEINQRIKFMDTKSPDFAKLSKPEKIDFITKLDIEASKETIAPTTEKPAGVEATKITLYRGVKELKPEYNREFQFYATNEKEAKLYGKVSKLEYEYKKPFYFESPERDVPKLGITYKEWDNYKKQNGVPAAEDLLHKKAQEKGYDIFFVKPLNTEEYKWAIPLKAITEPAKVTTEPEGIKGKVGEEKGKISGVAERINATAIEMELTKGFGHLAEFTPGVIKEQAKIFSDLINTNLDTARSMVRGETPIPTNTRGSVLVTAMNKYATNTANGELLNELASSPLTSELSAAGSELSLSRGNEGEINAVKVIQDINKIAEGKATKNKQGKSYNDIKNETVIETKTKVTNEVSKTNNKFSWTEFIRSIQCK